MGGFALMRENAHVFGLHQPGSRLRALRLRSLIVGAGVTNRLEGGRAGSTPALGTTSESHSYGQPANDH